MNKLISLLATLALLFFVTGCPAPEEGGEAGTPETTTEGDAMEGDAMEGDAMEGDAMEGDAMEGDEPPVEGPGN